MKISLNAKARRESKCWFQPFQGLLKPCCRRLSISFTLALLLDHMLRGTGDELLVGEFGIKLADFRPNLVDFALKPFRLGGDVDDAGKRQRERRLKLAKNAFIEPIQTQSGSVPIHESIALAKLLRTLRCVAKVN